MQFYPKHTNTNKLNNKSHNSSKYKKNLPTFIYCMKMQYHHQYHPMQESSSSASSTSTSAWGYYVAVGPARAMEPLERVARLAAESAVVIFSVSSCCMCHAVKRLFCGLGVNPTVHELDQDPRGREMERALIRLMGNSPAVPVVFVGGKLVGSMDRVMGAHINGSLVPLLKEAGALWL